LSLGHPLSGAGLSRKTRLALTAKAQLFFGKSGADVTTLCARGKVSLYPFTSPFEGRFRPPQDEGSEMSPAAVTVPQA
jgi:hypothetical protein